MTEREEIDTGSGDKRYVRRDSEGHFTEDQVDEGASLSRDIRQHAQKESNKGQGDKGDQ